MPEMSYTNPATSAARSADEMLADLEEACKQIAAMGPVVVCFYLHDYEDFCLLEQIIGKGEPSAIPPPMGLTVPVVIDAGRAASKEITAEFSDGSTRRFPFFPGAKP